MKKITLISLLLISTISVSSQGFNIEAGGAYNTSISQFGFELGAGVQLSERFSVISSYYHYALGFDEEWTESNDGDYSNDPKYINEFYINLGLRGNFIMKPKFNVYARLSATYTEWLYSEFVPELGIDGGVGAELLLGSFAPYFETTTNSVYGELNMFLGVRKFFQFPSKNNVGGKRRFNNKYKLNLKPSKKVDNS